MKSLRFKLLLYPSYTLGDILYHDTNLSDQAYYLADSLIDQMAHTPGESVPDTFPIWKEYWIPLSLAGRILSHMILSTRVHS
jgi:hypothetical protein